MRGEIPDFPRFFIKPQITYVGGKRPFKLKGRCVYISDVPEIKEKMGSVIEVPPGYRTDLASVPRIPLVYWRTGGKGFLASIVHDWLYEQCGEISRKAADDVFLEAMRDADDPPWSVTRWTMYLGVRVGGWLGWNNYRRNET